MIEVHTWPSPNGHKIQSWSRKPASSKRYGRNIRTGRAVQAGSS